MVLIIDDSYFEPCRACADDPQAEVRREVARFVGNRWISFVPSQNADAIALELRLSRDEDRDVRYNAVYFGLSSVREPGDDVLRRLLNIAFTDREPGMYHQVVSSLKLDPVTAAKILDEYLRGSDPALASAAREVYKDMTGRNPADEVPAGPETRASYAKAFRDLYEHLGRAYPNFSMKGIDWDEVGRALLPRASLATNEEQFGLLVEELVARLEDSHAVVLAGTSAPPMPDLPRWDPGLACLIDDQGRPVVYVVERGSLAEKAGVQPGMAVVSVDGMPAEEAIRVWMRRQRTYYGYSSERMLRYDAARGFLQRESKGAKIALVLRETDGRTKEVETSAERGPRYLPRLPVPREGIADAADVSWTLLENRIGYLYVRRIRNELEGSLDRALKGLGELKGLIIDVRGNSGGGFDAATAFRHFDLSAGDADAPQGPRYQGPIALLIDERCISAGEGWASWFIARKRARVFGTTTAGASSRKETYTLSNGLYRVVVPVKAYTGFLDRPIERQGLEPDVEVRCNAGDLARGKDTVAETAARWLSTTGRE